MILPPFSKTYGSRRVLNFTGISLEPGKVYALIGANGSGKSTFAKILAGVLKSDSGRLALGAKVGYMPQKNYAFRMSTRANLLLSTRDSARADRLLEALHLTDLADKRADKLSGGETARMALARLMMQRYDLVILDEPTAAMDLETTALSEEAIARYVRETGCCLLFITHSLRQAQRTADEILFFQNGALLESGPAARLLNAPESAELTQFLAFYGV